jgi:hypothetical protein
MKCPKCKNTITRVIIVRECFQYIFIKDDKFERVSPPDLRSLLKLNCPWCQEDISGMTPEIDALIDDAMTYTDR